MWMWQVVAWAWRAVLLRASVSAASSARPASFRVKVSTGPSIVMSGVKPEGGGGVFDDVTDRATERRRRGSQDVVVVVVVVVEVGDDGPQATDDAVGFVDQWVQVRGAAGVSPGQ